MLIDERSWAVWITTFPILNEEQFGSQQGGGGKHQLLELVEIVKLQAFKPYNKSQDQNPKNNAMKENIAKDGKPHKIH